MPKPGLGADHQRLRRLLPLPFGTPCPFCHKPMWPSDELDLDHQVPRVEGGIGGPVRWAHATCNRSAGASLGNRRRHRTIRSREW